MLPWSASNRPPFFPISGWTPSKSSLFAWFAAAGILRAYPIPRTWPATAILLSIGPLTKTTLTTRHASIEQGEKCTTTIYCASGNINILRQSNPIHRTRVCRASFFTARLKTENPSSARWGRLPAGRLSCLIRTPNTAVTPFLNGGCDAYYVHNRPGADARRRLVLLLL